MNRTAKYIVLATVVLLAGCATRTRTPELAQYQSVKYATNEKWGYEYIEGVTYDYPGASKAGKDVLPVCIAQNVQNKAVTLRGNQNSGFLGGTYWNTGNSETVGGGSVISYVSDDRNTVVAQGTNTHDTGVILAPNKDAVAFRLTAKRSTAGTTMAFSNLERASEDTGQMANQGFYKVGSWSGASPTRVLDGLKKTADTINTCIGSL
ncbi:hypothetical protein [Advenella sp. FME57]|uniref:hypothetical protein n=1 Tax=Advenella sp. FME57 TaxID=2742604 RepID=UPI001866B10F|nr:hypothetical protein [Advenella sp. FME57]